MWGSLHFALRADRFTLVDAFAIPALGTEWQRLDPRAALQIFDAFLLRHPGAATALARLLDELDGAPTGSADHRSDRTLIVARVRRELSSTLGRVALLRRDRMELGAPPPQDLEPIVLAEPEPVDELTFITFELFDQTGARLSGMPFELSVGGDVVDSATLTLGHVHHEPLDPGTTGTLRLPEPEPSADQKLVITLKDVAGRPVADQAVEVLLADGTRKQGVLDGSGQLELSGLPRGRALVFFKDAIPAPSITRQKQKLPAAKPAPGAASA